MWLASRNLKKRETVDLYLILFVLERDVLFLFVLEEQAVNQNFTLLSEKNAP